MSPFEENGYLNITCVSLVDVHLKLNFLQETICSFFKLVSKDNNEVYMRVNNQ